MSTDTPPVIVTALFRAQPGCENQLRAALDALVAPTRMEPGCLRYDLHQAKDQPAAFAFLESWRSEADLERHLASAHIRTLRERLPGLVAIPPEVTLWNQLA